MKKIIITNKQASKRLDKFLTVEFFSSRKIALQSRDKYSRGEIIKKIKNGDILVNNKTVKPSYLLKNEDILQFKNFSKEKKEILAANKKIPLRILFEDKNVIVINKQAGIQVHPSHNEKTNTIANALVNYFPKIKNVHDDSAGSEMRPGIAHRLDKDTSGVMVIAKNLKSLVELKKVFKNRKVFKKYIAVCEGIFKDKEGVIKKPIARSASYRKQVIARDNTKTKIRPAETQYKILKELGDYSLVKVIPKTGRMHQIRLHLASIGHPVVGDLIYAEKRKRKHENTDTKHVKRHLLHAKELKFELFGKKYNFSAPLDRDFIEFVKVKTKK
jgi:23S rRNA pseudouridine1911/1915/1917 synthase